MSDKLHSLTVVLEKDILNEDAEHLIDAIKCLRNVLSVSPNISDINSHVSQQRAKFELGQKIIKTIYPDEVER